MKIPSLLRDAEHDAISRITLSGEVLDVGGDVNSEYRNLFKGNPSYTTINLNDKTKPDIFHDLEQPLPVSDEQYDHVILINVLEHIYNFEQLVAESSRVLKKGGGMVVVVPFLFPVHPSPRDFFRYTKDTIEKLFETHDIKTTEITALGRGVFSAQYLMLDRLLPGPIRFVSYYTCRYFAFLCDYVFSMGAKVFGKKYTREDYPLGYCAHGTKS